MLSTRVGGVPEIVRDGENGLLVPPVARTSSPVRIRRLLDEPGLRDRLAAAAKPSVEAISSEASTAGSRPCSRRRLVERHLPRVLFVGRGRHPLPLPGWLAKKWDAVGEVLDYRFLGAAEPGGELRDEHFRLSAPARPRRLDGIFFYLRLPLRVRHQVAEFEPDAIIAADPFVGAAALLGRLLARAKTPVIVEVHGDWRTFARLYGSPSRRLLARAAEWLAPVVLRRADATRALSRFTSSLIEEVRGRPADARLPDVQRPLRVHRASRCGSCPSARRHCSSACSRRTRTWTGSRPRGGGSPQQMPAARLVIVGRGTQQARDRPARPRAARAGRARAVARPGRVSRVRSTKRRCSFFRPGPRGWAA